MKTNSRSHSDLQENNGGMTGPFVCHVSWSQLARQSSHPHKCVSCLTSQRTHMICLVQSQLSHPFFTSCFIQSPHQRQCLCYFITVFVFVMFNRSASFVVDDLNRSSYWASRCWGGISLGHSHLFIFSLTHIPTLKRCVCFSWSGQSIHSSLFGRELLASRCKFNCVLATVTCQPCHSFQQGLL